MVAASSTLNSGQALLLFGGWTAFHAAVIVGWRAYQVLLARRRKSEFCSAYMCAIVLVPLMICCLIMYS
jgi:hypothetical protein